MSSESFESYFLAGVRFESLGQISEALAAWTQALQLNPHSEMCANNLGALHLRAGRLDEAEPLLLLAHTLNPRFELPLASLVDLYCKQKRFEQALQCQVELLGIAQSGAHYARLATLLIENKKLARARQVLLKVHKVFPKDPDVWNALGSVHYRFAEMELAADAYRKAAELAPNFAAAVGNCLLALNYSGKSPKDIFKAHQRFGGALGKAVQQTFDTALHRGGALRVGFVSPDFFQHPVGQLIEPVLIELAKTALDVHLYYTNNERDDLTARLQNAFGDKLHFCFGLSNDVLFKQIVDHRIDVLFDLSGHTAGNRLEVFARRAAPIQATYLGYPNTTGVGAMDYRLVDEHTDPTGQAEPFCSEKLVRLEAPFLNLTAPRLDLPVNPLPSLENDLFTLGCFNNLAKLCDPVIALWAKILASLPTAKLVLKAASFSEPEVCSFQLARLESMGICAQRVTLHARMPYQAHLELYNTIDLCLDPFPFNGAATTVEALWMGVPAVVLKGQSHAGRVGYSINRSLGLDAFVADNTQQYLACCLHWFQNKQALNEIRLGMRTRLMRQGGGDASKSAKKLELAISEMASLYRQQQM